VSNEEHSASLERKDAVRQRALEDAEPARTALMNALTIVQQQELPGGQQPKKVRDLFCQPQPGTGITPPGCR
jgi:hypothetical protein